MDVEEKIKELEARIEKLENPPIKVKTDGFGKPRSAYDLSQGPYLQRKRK